MDTTKTTHIGLCAGYGGIELGLKRVIPTLRSVALCEIEAFPIANLVAKMEAGLMDAAPVWTDLKTFPWESFRDRVDILTGGYPCQPFSAAGKRAGKDDPRHLWPWIADGIRILRPRMCFFENVEGHISLGLSSVISDLEELGYQVSWGIFSASVDAGAPHQRKRVFILAHRIGDGHYWRELQDRVEGWSSGQLPQPHAGESCGIRSEVSGCCQVWDAGRMANTNHEHGHGEERGRNPETQGVPSEHWQEEHSRWESGRADAEGYQVWPSRPGEPQYAWEPPRVVADSKKSGWSSQRIIGDLGEKKGSKTSRGHQPTPTTSDCSNAGAEAMGNAEELLCDGSHNHSRVSERPEAISKSGDSSWKTMGNAKSSDCHKRSKHHRGESAATSNTQQVESGGGDCGSLRDCDREAQPPLGRDSHGSADWVDYAELCVSCDSRTDELRLLGNGVVPSTAERAFRTLLKELYGK